MDLFGQWHNPAAVPLGMRPSTHVQEIGWAAGLVPTPPGFEHPTAHSVVSRYTAKSWVIKRCHLKCGNYVVSNRMVKFKGKMVSVYAIQAFIIQGDSVARGPKLLSIKNYVIDIMTWKFICTYREWCKTGPAHNRRWNWSPFTPKHTWMHFSKFWNTFPKVSMLTAWISWRIASLDCSIVWGLFLYTLPFNRPQRKKSAGVRLTSPCL